MVPAPPSRGGFCPPTPPPTPHIHQEPSPLPDTLLTQGLASMYLAAASGCQSTSTSLLCPAHLRLVGRGNQQRKGTSLALSKGQLVLVTQGLAHPRHTGCTILHPETTVFTLHKWIQVRVNSMLGVGQIWGLT